MIIILLSLIWIVLSILEGFLQAHYYDLYPSEKKHKNLHPFYFIQRISFLILIWYCIPLEYYIYECVIFLIALCFIYSFFHNGMYYFTRNKLNPEIYKKKWFDDSDTSLAFIEMGAGFRTAMAAIGILFIIGVIL